MITRKDYHYDLPEELIAQFPAQRRDQARLMVLERSTSQILHKGIRDIPNLLPKNSVLVLNDTKVIPARIFGKKPTGGKVELFLYRRLNEPLRWEALLKMHGKRFVGMQVLLEEGIVATCVEILQRGRVVVEFSGIEPDEFPNWMEKHGHVPLPPYIRRTDEEQDKERYQTVYAKEPGAVAAPTAGLHLTTELLQQIKSQGMEIVYITLHVGLGTFMPLPDGDLTNHRLHSEFIHISEETANFLNSAMKDEKKIIAVGTTSVRALESAAISHRNIGPYSGDTNLFIYPPYEFRIVDGMLTNFHLPESSLLMLVAAFAGKEFTMQAYNTAVRERYRFFSYGDAMLIL